MPNEDRQKVKETFLNQPAETHTRHWDTLWQQNLTPWDRNTPSLALRDAVTDNPDEFGPPIVNATGKQRKRALVPGCGRGYDVLLLASLGYDAYGLDASQTAVEAARKLQRDSENDERYVPDDPSVGKGKATFVNADFFSHDFLDDIGGGNFDLIFDYTFLCALPPELRPRWAKRHSELLSSTGRLVCLEWPLGKSPEEGGPPFGLTSELYVRLLRRPGEEEEVRLHDEADVSESEDSLSRVAHFRPRRTHGAGVDTDYVSIWKHSTA